MKNYTKFARKSANSAAMVIDLCLLTDVLDFLATYLFSLLPLETFSVYIVTCIYATNILDSLYCNSVSNYHGSTIVSGKEK